MGSSASGAGADARSGRKRLMVPGLYVALVGGLLLAIGYVATPPEAATALGLVLFVGGILMIGVGAGLRAAWRAFWSLFP